MPDPTPGPAVGNIAPDAETFHRAAKILLDSNLAISPADAERTISSWRIDVAIGDDLAGNAHGQAALLTAVACALKASGGVVVQLTDSAARTVVGSGWQCGLTLEDAVRGLGATTIPEPEPEPEPGRPVIVIGNAQVQSTVRLQVSWDGWVASVSPHGRRLPETGNMVLAPVAAAALAVGEAFWHLTSRPDAAERDRTHNLWDPARTGDDAAHRGPNLQWLPTGGWLVGLGHLGQAAAWCWGLLPYEEPTQCTLVLVDDELTSVANGSTGMFVTPATAPTMKTRLVSEQLERLGFQTRMLEHRLADGFRPHTRLPGLALVGTDSLQLRRAISDFGWVMAVDVGLGADAEDYTSYRIKTFPDVGRSDEIPAWTGAAPDRAARIAGLPGYKLPAGASAEQRCGTILIAGRSAAASFVGVVAAATALAEPLRRLHAGPALATVSGDVRRPSPARTITATDATRPPGFLPAAHVTV